MKIRHIALSALVAFGGFAPVHAQDMAAGKVLATEVCAACHGANGIGVGDRFPNLAGQKAKYLDGQLKAFKADRRKNPMMKAVAEQLSADDIADLAAFFASLPGATPDTANSKPLGNLVAARMAFPADFERGFTHYTTINFANRKQLRKYYANTAALAAARDGRSLSGCLATPSNEFASGPEPQPPRSLARRGSRHFRPNKQEFCPMPAVGGIDAIASAHWTDRA